jgi:hypothetical protein
VNGGCKHPERMLIRTCNSYHSGMSIFKLVLPRDKLTSCQGSQQ